MQMRKYPGTQWEVSVVGLGCWGLGGQYGEVSTEDAQATVQAAYDSGINLMDTADAYGLEPGSSERLLGAVIPRFRDYIYLATKVGNWARRMGHPLPYTHPLHVIGCCEASLYRLQTDWIDLYQCHLENLTEPDVFLEAFQKLQQTGKIRRGGVSTNRLDVAQAFHQAGHLAVVQLDYSILNRSAEQDLLTWCQREGVGVLVRGPLGQGILTGRYTSEQTFTDQVRSGWNEGPGRERFLQALKIVEGLREIAGERSLMAFSLRWLIEQPGVTSVIPGARSPQQAAALDEATEIDWSAEDSAAVDRLIAPGQKVSV